MSAYVVLKSLLKGSILGTGGVRVGAGIRKWRVQSGECAILRVGQIEIVAEKVVPKDTLGGGLRAEGKNWTYCSLKYS